ncbi:MAG TPA: DUF2939 domain-containing protein [Acetobacteraceae bacterium]|jgi:hypothetical protein
MRILTPSRQALAKRTFGVLLLATFAYAITPYICLWRLYNAVEQGDAATLAQVVDWNSVRRGLKEDIAEGIIGMAPAETVARGNTLPAFGSGFVTGIASNVVDEEVTPQHLAEAVRDAQPATAPAQPAAPDNASGFGSLERAFFTSPTCFIVSIRLPGQDPDDPALRVELGLSGTGWKVIRAWVPQDLMDEANTHT